VVGVSQFRLGNVSENVIHQNAVREQALCHREIAVVGNLQNTWSIQINRNERHDQQRSESTERLTHFPLRSRNPVIAGRARRIQRQQCRIFLRGQAERGTQRDAAHSIEALRSCVLQAPRAQVQYKPRKTNALPRFHPL
jgi:hypothetical protein